LKINRCSIHQLIIFGKECEKCLEESHRKEILIDPCPFCEPCPRCADGFFAETPEKALENVKEHLEWCDE
jgi:hypothetical protein